jgi:hypothetical protein
MRHPSIRKSWYLNSPTSGDRSVGIVRLQSKSRGVCLLCFPSQNITEQMFWSPNFWPASSIDCCRSPEMGRHQWVCNVYQVVSSRLSSFWNAPCAWRRSRRQHSSVAMDMSCVAAAGPGPRSVPCVELTSVHEEDVFLRTNCTASWLQCWIKTKKRMLQTWNNDRNTLLCISSPA